MICTIEWNSLSLPDWQKSFFRIKRANLLQSYDYARAICPLNKQKARWGLIRIDGQEAGLVQLLEAGILFNAFHAVVLDRGPLWFDGFGFAVHLQGFFEEFNRQFPDRFGRKRRIIPEVEYGPAAQALFTNLGFKKAPTPGYQTIWLDLRPDQDVLRANLKQKWRNMLNKAERHDIIVEYDTDASNLLWLLEKYQQDKIDKGYDGPSPALLTALSKSFSEDGRMIISRATLQGEAIAAILVLCHGRSATYQIGWTSQAGRGIAAHNMLLWQMVAYLKTRGIDDFDLGGINDESAKNVKKFKEGLGGNTVCLVGHYF